MALCPYCNSVVGNVLIEDVAVNAFGGNQWRGITYGCGICQKVLSVAIDPVALADDLKNDLLAALRKR